MFDFCQKDPMKYLKQALIFFFIVDIIIFFVYQINPDLMVLFFPQFDLKISGNAYPRLVGILALALGMMRLYGALYIHEKGALIVSLSSWIVELVYIVSEIMRGQFTIIENLLGLIVAPLMIVWTMLYFRKYFSKKTKI